MRKDSGGRILVVEDNPDDRDLMKIALERSPLANEVVYARDGEEALERFQQNPDFSLVLLDLMLPKVSGKEVLAKIRAETKRIPVVVLTSSDEERDMMESYDFGANSYIRKPVSFDSFLEVAQQLGLYWLLLNERPSRIGDKD